ncbi:MAG: hypothetical protein ACI8UO_004398 [Verrucomicrobiales bacterium]
MLRFQAKVRTVLDTSVNAGERPKRRLISISGGI